MKTFAPEALAFENRLLSVLSREEQGTLSTLIDKLARHARSLAPQEEGVP